MLRVYDTGIKQLGAEEIIRDDDRGIKFRFLGSLAMGTLEAFSLKIKDTEIPVLTTFRSDGDVLVYSNVSVTGSFPFESTYGVAGRGYSDPAEESAVLEVAAECLLVYGSYYNGLSTRRDKTLVELRDGPRSLVAFGY